MCDKLGLPVRNQIHSRQRFRKQIYLLLSLPSLSYCVYETNRAAHLSLPAGSKHRIYSIQGNYLGPTASDRPVKIKVTSLRETRTFVTRLVLLFQDFDGKERSCLSCIVDFYISSGNIMLKYSMPPKDQVTHHSKLLSIENRLEQLVGEGKLTRAQADSVSIA